MMINLEIQRQVLEITRKIPKGKIMTYKAIAEKLDIHPRVVARALASNKHPIIIPCHRIVHADRRVGGYTPKGQKEKIKLLKKEGIKIKRGKICGESKFLIK
jgi:methylated-DNA-[protein]-cysteine S-methyltransferase